MATSLGINIYPSMAAADLEMTGVWTYFQHSNTAGKCIVIALLFFSLLAWTVMIGKYLELSRLRELNLNVEKRLGEVLSILNLERPFWQDVRGPFADLLRTVMHAYYRTDSGGASQTARIGHVENALQRGVARAAITYESKMVLLGSIVTGAPFLGLLGTVWGVMDAFGNIALKNTASIQMLAPGVSGALLTTVAALLVAIPAVFGYNFLLTQSKIAITEVENFASSLADRIEIEAFEIENEPGPEGEPFTLEN